MSNRRRAVIGIAMAAVMTFGLASCVVSAEPAPVAASSSTADEYSPLYHDGYVVYFSNAGLPYYYLNGAMVWIPSTHPFYGRYVGYYGRHRHHYWRWNRTHGRRYRTYRRRTVHRRHPAAHRRARPGRRDNRRQPVNRGGSGGRRR